MDIVITIIVYVVLSVHLNCARQKPRNQKIQLEGGGRLKVSAETSAKNAIYFCVLP